jgi:hypothetical protein
MEEMMLKLREFCYNDHPFGVKILAKFTSVESGLIRNIA